MCSSFQVFLHVFQSCFLHDTWIVHSHLPSLFSHYKRSWFCIFLRFLLVLFKWCFCWTCLGSHLVVSFWERSYTFSSPAEYDFPYIVEHWYFKFFCLIAQFSNKIILQMFYKKHFIKNHSSRFCQNKEQREVANSPLGQNIETCHFSSLQPGLSFSLVELMLFWWKNNS